MNRFLSGLTLVALGMLCTDVFAHAAPDIAVEFVGDSGSVLPQLATTRENPDTTRAYLEAVDGQNYAIRVRNRSAQRIGLVIAVDGRNIITGERSQLGASEPMYILGPWQEATYRGWRTSLDRIHRFVFSSAEDSYAGKWGDYSAMGVNAIAVYKERAYEVHQKGIAEDRGMPAAPGESSARAGGAAPEPGTGFGEGEQSVARRVQFDPMPVPSQKLFVKYEWRQTLCAKGILDCHQRKNRFWPNDDSFGFVPYPPGS